MGDPGNKVEAALLSVARIDEPREHGRYGYWHRNDHLAEVWARPGVMLAQRCVATPRCLRERLADAGEVAGAQYFTYYLLGEPLGPILEMFRGGSPALREAGRMRLLASPSSGGIFRLAHAYASPRAVVSAAAVPFLPHAGVFVSVSDYADEAARERLEHWYDLVHVPDLLGVRHVTGCYWFESRADAPVVHVARPAPLRSVRILFLDGDPVEMVRDLVWKLDQWRSAGRAHPEPESVRHLLAGPFELVTGGRYDWFD